MARFSCCGLLRRSISMVCLLVMLLILAIPAALLVYLLVLTFRTPTIAPAKALAPGERQYMTFRLAWQEPFTYEAKVYTSQSPDFSNNESFFDNAQLLWHIEPQPISNRYPVFRRKASVHIPSQLRSSPIAGQGLYAHMFIQQAGRFNPHPDLADPYLVLAKIPLVQWSDVTSSDSVDAPASVTPSKEHRLELLGVSSASWAIVLENHTYSWHDVPSDRHLTYRDGNSGTYNPALLPNTFTKRQPEKKPLAVLKDKQLAADVYQQAVDVELELSGIKQGWVSAKAGLTGFFAFKKLITVETVVPHPLDPGQSVTHSYQERVKNEDFIPFDSVHNLSVPALICVSISFALMCALFPAAIRLVVRFWSTPVTRWIGMSRSTVAILLIANSLDAMRLVMRSKVSSALLNPGLAAAIIVATALDDMTFAPWVALSWLLRKVFRRKSPQSLDRSSSTQRLALVAESKTEFDSTDANLTSNPYFRRSEPIIAARRGVDDIAMRWIHLLAFPIIATAAVYSLFAQEADFWSLDFVEYLLIYSEFAFISLAWLPQIVVNYKTKSGSLTPVAYNFIELVGYVAGGILGRLVKMDGVQALTVYDIPILVSPVVIIMQRIAYFKRAKQD